MFVQKIIHILVQEKNQINEKRRKLQKENRKKNMKYFFCICFCKFSRHFYDIQHRQMDYIYIFYYHICLIKILSTIHTYVMHNLKKIVHWDPKWYSKVTHEQCKTSHIFINYVLGCHLLNFFFQNIHDRNLVTRISSELSNLVSGTATYENVH